MGCGGGNSGLNMVFGCCLIVVVVAAATILQCATAQTTHIVGDSLGWIIPSTSTVYPTWSSSKTFKVGDSLVFQFMDGVHTIAEIGKSAYDKCDISATPIGSVLITSPATVHLNSVGNHYYICTVGQHCLAGQKLSIKVVSADSATPTPPPTATPPPATPPTATPPTATPPTATPPTATPPTATPTTSPVASPPSTTATSPSSGGTATPPSIFATSPSGTTSSTATPPSSSSAISIAVLGGFSSVSLLSFILAFLV